MGSTPACQTHGKEWWVVIHRNVNYSAFNGYHPTPSDWSAIQCNAPGPHRKDGSTGSNGSYWRTKAAYVDDLPGESTWRRPTECTCNATNADPDCPRHTDHPLRGTA